MGLLDDAQDLVEAQAQAARERASAERAQARDAYASKVSDDWGGIPCTFAGVVTVAYTKWERSGGYLRESVEVPVKERRGTFLLADEIRLTTPPHDPSVPHLIGTCNKHGDYIGAWLWKPHQTPEGATIEDYRKALVQALAHALRETRCPLCDLEKRQHTCPTCGTDLIDRLFS